MRWQSLLLLTPFCLWSLSSAQEPARRHSQRAIHGRYRSAVRFPRPLRQRNQCLHRWRAATQVWPRERSSCSSRTRPSRQAMPANKAHRARHRRQADGCLRRVHVRRLRSERLVARSCPGRRGFSARCRGRKARGEEHARQHAPVSDGDQLHAKAIRSTKRCATPSRGRRFPKSTRFAAASDSMYSTIQQLGQGGVASHAVRHGLPRRLHAHPGHALEPERLLARRAAIELHARRSPRCRT